jgi:type II secretory pathway pseudopilin PulG
MNRNRIATLILCLTAVIAMLAMSAIPALAGEDNKGQEKKAERQEQSAQQADGEASSQDSSTQDSSQTAPAEDPDGKRADGEGEPRGQSSDSCQNTNTGNWSGNGANHHGPYDSTCDGSASKNGNGGGGANGRPCAGCVGNADNKNPKGQYPDGNHDGNAGYECDGNNGVGRSNPAHTGCQGQPTPTPSPTTCPNGSPMPANGHCDTPPTCPNGSPMPANGHCDTPPTCPNGSPMPSNGKCDEVKPNRCPTNPNMPAGHPDCNPQPPVCPAGTDMAGHAPGATGCDVPENNVCPAGTDMAGLPPGAHGCNVDDVFVLCPAGTDNAGFPMTDLRDCNNDEVLGEVLKVCPSGPFAGMPMLNESDCQVPDRVLPKVIHRDTNPVASVGGKVVGAVGAVLPFTGAGDLYFLIALAGLLIAAGAVSLKLRNQN